MGKAQSKTKLSEEDILFLEENTTMNRAKIMVNHDLISVVQLNILTFCECCIAFIYLPGMVRGLLKNQPKWSGDILEILKHLEVFPLKC